MKINHRIVSRGDDPFWRHIKLLGLPIDQVGLIWVVNITEDNPVWPKVERFIARYDAIDQVSNIFTKREINTAEWLRVFALGHHGYPQPGDDFGYVEATYDTDSQDYCPICHIGAVQNAPFRLRTEPKASHSQFLQLNWVFDELFVRREAREGLTATGITGIEFLTPVLNKRDQPSEQVDQMRIRTVLPAALDITGFQPVTCKPNNEESSPGKSPMSITLQDRPHCGRVKYHSMHRGLLKVVRGVFSEAPDVVKSNEWFGSGRAAFRFIVVSQRFRQVVTQAKWRGLGFEPIELIDART
jgi:hypothetical protein